MPDPRDPSDDEREARRRARRRAEIEARPSMSPPGRAPDRLRLATWNLNSLRARLPAVERFLDRAHPDVLCLQETKTATVPETTIARFYHHGYELSAVGAGAYNGVAIAARHAIADVRSSGDFGVD